MYVCFCVTQTRYNHWPIGLIFGISVAIRPGSNGVIFHFYVMLCFKMASIIVKSLQILGIYSDI